MVKGEYHLTGEKIKDILLDWVANNLCGDPRTTVNLTIYFDEKADPPCKAIVEVEVDV